VLEFSSGAQSQEAASSTVNREIFVALKDGRISLFLNPHRVSARKKLVGDKKNTTVLKFAI
jgi:hypothetical protein